MASLWLIGLGLAAGYLMQKKQNIAGRLDQAAKTFNEAAEPADGLATDDIRKVQRTVPEADVSESMNLQDLTRGDAQKIRQAQTDAAMQVVQYESVGPPPIEGVYLHFDNHGV